MTDAGTEKLEVINLNWTMLTFIQVFYWMLIKSTFYLIVSLGEHKTSEWGLQSDGE